MIDLQQKNRMSSLPSDLFEFLSEAHYRVFSHGFNAGDTTTGRSSDRTAASQTFAPRHLRGACRGDL